jgi:GT2 family glycosyltransferase
VVVCSHLFERLPMLRACLDSLERQTLRPTDIIVVIDGDAELFAEMLGRPGIRLIGMPRRSGLSAARNAGIAVADSQYIAFLDDDAVADEGWLEALCKAMQETGALGAGGVSLPNWIVSEPRWLPRELLWTRGCTHDGLPLGRVFVRNVLGGCACFDRKAFANAGGFDETLGRRLGGLAGAEETELCLRVAQTVPGARFIREPTAVIHHAVPPERARVRYVLRRCFAEGRSKARLAQLHSRGDLGTELEYLVKVVPRAWAKHASIRGDTAWGVSRAFMLGAAVVAAAVGYGTNSLHPAHACRTAGWSSGAADVGSAADGSPLNQQATRARHPPDRGPILSPRSADD